MHIKIGNKLIVTPIETILYRAQRELTNGKLKDIQTRVGDRNINITCPCHKGGQESHPSCQILSDVTDDKLEAGTAHCFTCGYSGPLYKVIGDLFNKSESFGKEWLLERFGNTIVENQLYLTPFEKITPPINFMDESELVQYDYYHPYMWQRHLSKEVVDQFRVGYDKDRQAITFPVYDEKHRLVMVTARSIYSKRFYIPEGVDKPVYLLYDILQRNVTKVYVCESQINTLTLRSWGLDSIGLFGTGSFKQLEKLKHSGIRTYILCFDGDEAGRKGAKRFKENIGKEVFITDVILPPNRDVNDLTKEEFLTLVNHS